MFTVYLIICLMSVVMFIKLNFDSLEDFKSHCELEFKQTAAEEDVKLTTLQFKFYMGMFYVIFLLVAPIILLLTLARR